MTNETRNCQGPIFRQSVVQIKETSRPIYGRSEYFRITAEIGPIADARKHVLKWGKSLLIFRPELPMMRNPWLDIPLGDYEAVSYTHLTLPTNREV